MQFACCCWAAAGAESLLLWIGSSGNEANVIVYYELGPMLPFIMDLLFS